MLRGFVNTVAVRPMLRQDVPKVTAIAAVVPTAPHWPEVEYDRMLKVIAASPAKRGAWVATFGGQVHGFAMATHAGGTAELEAVVTAPEHRRQGAGSMLLAVVVAWSAEQGATRLLLEVRASNRDALALYARLGFKEDGVRRGYYRNPDEDAVLLSLGLPTDGSVSESVSPL